MNNPFIYDKPKRPQISIESLNVRQREYKPGRYLLQSALFGADNSVAQDPIAPTVQQYESATSVQLAPLVVQASEERIAGEQNQFADIEASQQQAADDARAILAQQG